MSRFAHAVHLFDIIFNLFVNIKTHNGRLELDTVYKDGLCKNVTLPSLQQTET